MLFLIIHLLLNQKTMRSYFPLLFVVLMAGCSVPEATDKWINFTSKDGGFSVNMPAPPLLEDKAELTINGKQTVHYCTWKQTRLPNVKFKLFQVSYTNCPSIAADQQQLNTMLDSSIKLQMTYYTDNALNVDTVKLSGYPARAFIYQDPLSRAVTICKECIANNRKYDLVVVSAKEFADDPEINDFFESFVIQ
jgi:predicted acylesterase/phospholipase RssA